MPEFRDEDARILQRLADRADITDVVTRFAVALDTRDWPLFETCFAKTVTLEFPATVGTMTLPRSELSAVPSRFFPRLDATQHISANHQVAVDGDVATCFSTLYAQHYLRAANGDPVQRQIGYYLNHLRREDAWRIERCEQRVSWNEGNWQVYLHAEAGLGGS